MRNISQVFERTLTKQLAKVAAAESNRNNTLTSASYAVGACIGRLGLGSEYLRTAATALAEAACDR